MFIVFEFIKERYTEILNYQWKAIVLELTLKVSESCLSVWVSGYCVSELLSQILASQTRITKPRIICSYSILGDDITLLHVMTSSNNLTIRPRQYSRDPQHSARNSKTLSLILMHHIVTFASLTSFSLSTNIVFNIPTARFTSNIVQVEQQYPHVRNIT